MQLVSFENTDSDSLDHTKICLFLFWFTWVSSIIETFVSPKGNVYPLVYTFYQPIVNGRL